MKNKGLNAATTAISGAESLGGAIHRFETALSEAKIELPEKVASELKSLKGAADAAARRLLQIGERELQAALEATKRRVGV